ncbi:MAG: hypothetical protein LBK72_00025, partial [Bifidobacteriaceae bacterium]|nr:hypothetical protein [Bifidobacteriaceae bacterium]
MKHKRPRPFTLVISLLTAAGVLVASGLAANAVGGSLVLAEDEDEYGTGTLTPSLDATDPNVETTTLVVLVNEGVAATDVETQVTEAQVAVGMVATDAASPHGFTWVSEGVVARIDLDAAEDAE